MTKDEIHVGDVGTKILIELVEYDDDGEEVPVDISTATELKIYFEKSDGTTVSKTGALENTGEDGLLYYITETDDLNIAGDWRIQVKVSFPASKVWYSNVEPLRVHENINIAP